MKCQLIKKPIEIINMFVLINSKLYIDCVYVSNEEKMKTKLRWKKTSLKTLKN